LSSSVATTTLGIKNRVDSIEAKTGSYATTGSNIFRGNQTITGSLYISQDLIVAGSSSIQNISSSILNIGDNIITVNALNPSVRFGGLAVIDSGSSPQVSGSMLFDSVNDQWIFIHQNQSSVTSSILLMGPQTYDNIGNEAFPTNNRLLKSVNAEHLGDSNITDNGTKVSINSNTEITGSLIVTGDKITVNAVGGDEGGEILLGKAVTNTTLSGSGVTIDVWQNRLRFFEQGGNARGAFLDISTLANGVGTNLLGTAATASYVEYSNVANKPTIVSGSSQIAHDSTTGYVANRHIDHTAVSISAGNGLSGGGDISTTRTLTLDTGSVHFLDGVKKELNTEGVISGSSQILAGTTIHSGSFFNGISVVSGSAQISFNGITDKPTLVSGSSQITYSGISSIPSGIVSGSAQIDLTATTNYASGILTRLNAVGVFSGSAQVTLSSTTGYGSVLNQAVLTSSSPTFAGLTNNGTYTQATTSTQPLTINGDSGDTNGLFRIQMDSVSDSFASGARTYLGDGGIDIFLGTSNSSYTPSNTYIALNHSGEISMGAGSANKHFTLSTSGNLTISGTIGASNFSGSSSGTNTGDQTNISGYATSLNGYANQTVYTILDGPANGPVIKVRYDSATANRYIDIGSKDGNGVYSEGLKLYNGSTMTWLGYTVYHSGNVPTWNQNTTGTAANITASSNTSLTSLANLVTVGTITSGTWNGTSIGTTYTAAKVTAVNAGTGVGVDTTTGSVTVSIGQSVATSALPTFAGANLTDRLYLNGGSYEGSILFGSSTTWRCGIRQHDDADAELRIWTVNNNGMIFLANGYNGEPADIARPTDGLVVGPGNNVGIGNFSSSDPGYKLQVNGTVGVGGNLTPTSNNSYNLGSASFGWANVYTNDLHLSNMNKPEGNDIDGTNGTWTIQEGAENLYIINNNNGKKYKIDLTEII
jgi:hypothetical protein